MSEENSGEKKEVENATVVAEEEKGGIGQLPTAPRAADNGVNEGSSLKEAFKRIDLRDLEAATAMRYWKCYQI